MSRPEKDCRYVNFYRRAILLAVVVVATAFAAFPGNITLLSPKDTLCVERRDSVVVLQAPKGEPSDSAKVIVAGSTDVANVDSLSWWRHLMANKFNLKDSTIRYPKFIGFCVNVYNWADRFFNSFDEEYVQGTGKRWKAYVKNDNWLDSYAMRFDKKMNMRMMSNVTVNAGPYIQYMAVSLGYQWDITNLIGGTKPNRKRLDFGFTCARFNAGLYYWKNTGGNIIRSFGDYNRGRLINIEMPGVEITSFGVEAIYIFNNRKYCHNACYGYGRIQRKSAGSFLAGFSYTDQNILLDFSTLPAVLEPYLTIAPLAYKFNYHNYCLAAGYAYNAVFSRNFTFNVTALPTVGILRCSEDSVDGNATMISLNIKMQLALVYNWKNLFAGINGRMDGHLYNSDRYTLFNAMETLSAVVGWRF